MFFRALTMFRFPTALDFDHLDDCLRECELRPVGPLELSSRGFVSPFGLHASVLWHRRGDALWLALGGEDRLLPATVIERALQERLGAIQAREGRIPGGRARKRLREEIVAELLPRSHVAQARLDALVDLRRGVIALDTTSRRAAEGFVSELRRALGSFPALPLNAEVSPRAVLTGLVAGDALPDGLSLGEDCTLEDPVQGGSKVKCYRVELRSEEVAEHLRAGRHVTSVALVLDDHVSFDLDEQLVVRKLRFLDGAIDALETGERDDMLAELDARFALMAGEFGRLFDLLEAKFKISKVD